MRNLSSTGLSHTKKITPGIQQAISASTSLYSLSKCRLYQASPSCLNRVCLGNMSCPIGCIPEAIGSLSLLTSLRLGHNNLSGRIPSSLSRLVGLETLDLAWNQIAGTVPMRIGALTALRRLSLGHNKASTTKTILVQYYQNQNSLGNFSHTTNDFCLLSCVNILFLFARSKLLVATKCLGVDVYLYYGGAVLFRWRAQVHKYFAR